MLLVLTCPQCGNTEFDSTGEGFRCRFCKTISQPEEMGSFAYAASNHVRKEISSEVLRTKISQQQQMY